jgi:hypothetical protein
MIIIIYGLCNTGMMGMFYRQCFNGLLVNTLGGSDRSHLILNILEYWV